MMKSKLYVITFKGYIDMLRNAVTTEACCRLSSKIDPFLRLNLTPYGLNFNQFKTISF